MPLTMNELSGWAQNWCLPQGACPPVVVQQGCCPTTGLPLRAPAPRFVSRSSGSGGGGGGGGGGSRRGLPDPRRAPDPDPMISIDTPEGIALVSKTTTSVPQPKPATSITKPATSIAKPSPATKIGTAYTSASQPVIAAPIQVGSPGVPGTPGYSSGTGLKLPRSFEPAGGFVAPKASMEIKAGPPLVATKAAQAPASANRFFPGGWQNAKTLGPTGELDVAAIQNQGRQQVAQSTQATQAVPGAQGGYMPTATGITTGVAGFGSRDTDPFFLPRYALGALGVYMAYCGLLKKRKKNYTKAALGAGLAYAAYSLNQA